MLLIYYITFVVLSLVLAEGQQSSKRFHISILSFLLTFLFETFLNILHNVTCIFNVFFSFLDFTAEDDPFSFG